MRSLIVQIGPVEGAVGVADDHEPPIGQRDDAAQVVLVKVPSNAVVARS